MLQRPVLRTEQKTPPTATNAPPDRHRRTSRRRTGNEGDLVAARACKLKRLKGLGEVFATGLTHEAFWRDFANRRQVGGAFGLTPWPWDSGDTHGDQPISQVGNRRARTLA